MISSIVVMVSKSVKIEKIDPISESLGMMPWFSKIVIFKWGFAWPFWIGLAV